MLIDSHAHISDEKFNSDRQAVLERASAAGVKYIIEVGCDPVEWNKVAELSKQPQIFSMFGVHPHDAVKYNAETKSALETFLADKKCVAVGEIGLDYHYDLSPRNIQKTVFADQLNLAVKHNKPVCIHCRSAYDDLFKIFDDLKQLPKGVIHCFSGNLDDAKKILDFGFLIGIDGPCTYPKSDKLKEVILNTDISKLLVETDCPYLAPQLYRGQRNEPAYVEETAKKISEIKKISFEDVCNATVENTVNLFGLVI